MKRNLGIMMGGKSAEHEVSLQSANSIISAVNKEKYNLFLIGIDKQGNWFLLDNTHYLNNSDNPETISLNLKEATAIALVPKDNSHQIINLESGENIGKLDVVFSIIHGTTGEDGSLQGYFNVINLPFVGADVLGASIGMDKDVSKRLLKEANIAVSDFVIIRKNEAVDYGSIIEKLGLPLFVKPAASGSSVGVSKAKDLNELIESINLAIRYDTKVIVEEFIEGREIECAVMGNYAYQASVPGEIIAHHEFYSYEAKYIDKSGADLKMPAELSTALEEKVKQTAIESYKTLCCQGLARVDMFVTAHEKIYLNEINTLPGFTAISMFPKLFDLSGIPYPDLIDRLIEFAFERQQIKDTCHSNYL
jgi:D-alanine-D-alanine ligase